MITTFAPTMGKHHKWTGSEVRELKERHGLTLQRIADEIGAQTYVPVWRWVNGKSNPSPIFCRELDKLKKRLEKEES